jgi:hypothetical protein
MGEFVSIFEWGPAAKKAYTPLVLGKLAKGVRTEELVSKRARKYFGPYSEAIATILGGDGAGGVHWAMEGGRGECQESAGGGGSVVT